MQCYFVKSTYNGNNYKISDFYVNNNYIQNAQKMLDLNFKPVDGAVSIMTRQLLLPDNSNLRDYTHIIVPELEKVYEILKIDQQNNEQYFISLSEDVFIGNYKNIKNEDFQLTRTNSFTKERYLGVNDITDMSYDYTYNIKLPEEEHVSGSKLWSLVFIQPIDKEMENDLKRVVINLNYGNKGLAYTTQKFSSMAALRTAYPEVYDLKTPTEVKNAINNSIAYGKNATIGRLPYVYGIKWNESTGFYNLSWNVVNNLWTDEFYKETQGLSVYQFQTIQSTVYKYYGVSNHFRYAYVYDDNNNVGQTLQNVFLDWIDRYYNDDTKPRNERVWAYDDYSDIPNNHQIGDMLLIGTSPNNKKLIRIEKKKEIFDKCYIKKDQFLNESKEYIRNNYPDIPQLILVLPFNYNMTHDQYGKWPMLPAEIFNSIEYELNNDTFVAAKINAIKIVSEDVIFGKNSLELDWDLPQHFNTETVVTGLESFRLYWETDDNDPWNEMFSLIGVLRNINTNTNVSLNQTINNIFDYEPFKSYELWIYGKKYDIPAIYAKSLYMTQSLVSTGLNYNVYRDKERTKLYLSGSVSMDAMWTIDQLALYAQMNPTYKDEFTLQQTQKWTSSITNMVTAPIAGAASGAAAGTMIGGPFGAAAGAGVGAVGGTIAGISGLINTGIQTHFDKKQFALMQESKRMQNDQIFGDPSSASLVRYIRSGVFWVVKTNNKSDHMKNEYYRKGYPTLIMSKMDSLTWTPNPLFNNSNSKVISGYFLKTIKNNYITNEINKKLSSGVILIE